MKKLVVVVLAVIGLLTVVVLAAAAVVGAIAVVARPGVPDPVVLEVDLERGVIEAVPDDPIAELLLGGYVGLRDVVDALDRAAADDRVAALVARVGGGGIGLAHAQELRDAVLRFRASGKRAVATAETFGEFGPGNEGYYLATAFDEIWLQPSGDVGLTGVSYEAMFLAGGLDKLGVEAQYARREAYKSGPNRYTESRFTPEQRESLETLLASRFEQIVAGVATGRGLERAAVRALVDRAPLLADEALEAGLVDGLAYPHDVRERVIDDAGADATALGLADYAARLRPTGRGGRQVALIHGYGEVMRGRSAYSPLDGAVSMGSDTVAAALREAVEAEVDAIVFRIDSPGGSYIASDSIRRAVREARDAGVPVVVTMGNLGASGGYFVAMEADRIVAQPATITASIGVYGGKLVTRDLWGKLGISFDEVHLGENSRMWSETSAFDERGWERLDASLDRVYEDFTRKVGEARDLDAAALAAAAGGRIWTGADALRLGLVDRLGGYHEALLEVRTLLEVEAGAPLEIRRFPRRQGALTSLLGALGRPSTDERMAQAVTHVLREVQPLVKRARRLGLEADPPGLRLQGPAGH